MITHIRIVGFPGASDLEPPMQRLLDGSVASAINAGAEVRSIYMQDADLPFCVDDGEDEDETLSCAGIRRKGAASHHVLLIATPELDSGRTRPFENALNWVRRVGASAGSCLGRLVSKSASPILWLVGCLDEIRLQIAFRRALTRLGADAIPAAGGTLKANATNIREKTKCNLE